MFRLLGSVSDSHAYTVPGIYTIKLTIRDDDGKEGAAKVQYVVVYDPDGGFVTGGGFFASAAGALKANPSAVGRATFGFVSKYHKGADRPEGQTEFQFKAGNLNFHSESYEWLTVANSKAQYKGTGTINGQGDYGFFLTVIDGQLKNDGAGDRLRIRIWDRTKVSAEVDSEDEGGLIYDNLVSDGRKTGDDPTTVIQGGQIVIHK